MAKRRTTKKVVKSKSLKNVKNKKKAETEKEISITFNTKPSIWLAVTVILASLVIINLVIPYFVRPASTQSTNKTAELIYLVDEECDKCYDVSYNKIILSNYGLQTNESYVSIHSIEGSTLLGKYNITKIPTFILSPDAVSNTNLMSVWLQVGTVESDGYLIFRSPEGFAQVEYGQNGNFYDLGNITDYTTYLDLTTNLTKQPITKDSCAANDTIEMMVFVVSECPWCKRLELEALANLTKDFKTRLVIEPHYFFYSLTNGSLASMHGQSEYEENLRQVCADQQGKWFNYTLCIDNNGTYSSCSTQVGLNLTRFNDCLSNQALTIARQDANLSLDYAIQGTPTIVVNCNLLYTGQWTNYTTIKNDLCSLYTSKPTICNS